MNIHLHVCSEYSPAWPASEMLLQLKQDVDYLKEVVAKAGFDSAYTFLYSKRTGTPAATMENQVPEEEVKVNFDKVLKFF